MNDDASARQHTNSRNYDDIPAIFDSLYLLYFVKVRDFTLYKFLWRVVDCSNATTKLAHARIFWRGKEARKDVLSNSTGGSKNEDARH